MLVVTFVLTGQLSRGDAAAGIAVFGLAGLGCSALLPLTIGFGEEELTTMSAAVVGGIIAFYQLGYGIAAFGAGPLQNAGISLSAIFGGTAIVAAVMAGLSFLVVKGRQTRARAASGRRGARTEAWLECRISLAQVKPLRHFRVIAEAEPAGAVRGAGARTSVALLTPSRSAICSPTRIALAIAVSAGLTAPMLGKTLVSAT